MTSKNHSDLPSEVAEAFNLLYGDGPRNLTSRGYQKALRRLRLASPAEARRVQRILGRYLPHRFFPRKQRAWSDTSEGLRARVALLPDNPHLLMDIKEVREALRVPDDHVNAEKGDTFWNLFDHESDPSLTKQDVEGQLAGWWRYFHDKAAVGKLTSEDDEVGLSQELRESAIAAAHVNLAGLGEPEWLTRPPQGSPSYEALQSPLNWAVGRLIERHRLPWHVASPLATYVLTQDSNWVVGLEFLNIEYPRSPGPYEDPEPLTIAVGGIDEFITKSDWDRIWSSCVRPEQDRLWELRGGKPQGRRGKNIPRLEKALPTYRKIVEDKLTVPKILKKRIPEDWVQNMDQETVRRTLDEIAELLTPLD